MNKYIFGKSKKLGATTIEYVDLNEDEVNDFNNDLTETETSKLFKRDIAVIKTEDDYPY